MVDKEPVKVGIWSNSPIVGLGAVARNAKYSFVILDFEHGTFSHDSGYTFIQQLKSEGITVFVKPGSSERWFVQQALDHGADGVIIPHVIDAGHVKEVAAYTKFAPAGTRSFAAGTQSNFSPVSPDWVLEANRRVLCIPMIERTTALDDVERIMADENVDGVFIGSADLSLSRGRGMYTQKLEDFADFEKIAGASVRAGKPWGIGGWTPREREFAMEHGATWIATCMDFAALESGLRSAAAEIL